MKQASVNRAARRRKLRIYADYCTGKYTLKELGAKYGFSYSRASTLLKEAAVLHKDSVKRKKLKERRMKTPYLVTGNIVEAFPEIEKSAWFKSGYELDKDKKYYIALMNDEEWKKVAGFLAGPELDHGFAFAIMDSNVSLETDRSSDDGGDELSWSHIKFLGLFKAIEHCLDLTKPQNIAYVIYKFCEREGIKDYFDFATRVAFINGR